MTGEPNKLNVVGIVPASPAENIPVILDPYYTALSTEPTPWIASRNGFTRTQICKHVIVNGALGTMYTVTSGKTLYITSAQICGTTSDTGSFYIDIANSAAVSQYVILCGYFSIYGTCYAANSFPMPIVVPSGYIVRIYHSVSAVWGCFQGWEQ